MRHASHTCAVYCGRPAGIGNCAAGHWQRPFRTLHTRSARWQHTHACVAVQCRWLSAKRELQKLMAEELLQECSLLVFCNKVDLPNAISAEEMARIAAGRRAALLCVHATCREADEGSRHACCVCGHAALARLCVHLWGCHFAVRSSAGLLSVCLSVCLSACLPVSLSLSLGMRSLHRPNSWVSPHCGRASITRLSRCVFRPYHCFAYCCRGCCFCRVASSLSFVVAWPHHGMGRARAVW